MFNADSQFHQAILDEDTYQCLAHIRGMENNKNPFRLSAGIELAGSRVIESTHKLALNSQTRTYCILAQNANK